MKLKKHSLPCFFRKGKKQSLTTSQTQINWSGNQPNAAVVPSSYC